MKPTKRFLSVLLSLCLVLGMLPGVAFAANNYSQFTDVNTSDWYNEAVQYVSGQGLMSGTSATTFEPDASTTRGMIATILYRLEGSPAYLNSGYTDVPANEWYAPAVSWAKTYNVVSGYGDGKFGPNDAISREQLASILFRYSQLKKYDTAMYGDLTKYSDQGKISSYAKIPLSWAVGKGVITGIGDGTLDPQGGATRAQVAAILQRYMDNVVAKGNPLTPGSNVGFAPLPNEPEETAPATYTVTFLMNDGTGKVYNEQVVKAGSKAVKPETPRLQDRTFYGWFLTSNATGRAFDFNSVINSDVTLYADWGGNRYDWTWRPNGNTGINPGDVNSNLPNYNQLLDAGVPDVEMYSFTTDTWDIPVGTSGQMVKFEAEIFAEKETIGEVTIKDENDQLIGKMTEVSPGKYELEVRLQSSEVAQKKYHAECGGVTSASVTIGYYKAYTSTEIAALTSVVNDIDTAMASYVDANGDLIGNANEAAAALEAQLDSLKSTSGLTYTKDADGTYIINLPSGLVYRYSFQVKGVDSASFIISNQPFKGEYGLDNDGTDLAALSDAATDGSSRLVDSRTKYTFNSATSGNEMNTAADGNYDAAEVSLDALKDLVKAEVVSWHGHGGYDPVYGSYMGTGTRYNATDFTNNTALQADSDAGRVILKNGRWWITGGFVEKYSAPGDLAGHFLYLGTCSSGADMVDNANTTYELAQAFVNRGAVVIANTRTISTKYNTRMENSVFTRLSEQKADGTYYTLSEALQYAKNQHGQVDFASYTDRNGVTGSAEVRIFPATEAAAGYHFQKATGTVTGKVLAASDNSAISNALVRVYDANGACVVTTRTNAAGEYTFNNLPVGDYVVQISAGHYKTVRMSVRVSDGAITNTDTFMLLQVSDLYGTANGRITDATVTNKGVPGVTVNVRNGWNNYRGTIRATVTTDADGKYVISSDKGLLLGAYTIEFSAAGYAKGYKNIILVPDSWTSIVNAINPQNAIISPLTAAGAWRIVLSWKDHPSDLDSHLAGPLSGGSRFHLFYPYADANMGSPWSSYVKLDLDNTTIRTRSDPETTTIVQQLPGKYVYSVHDFSNYADPTSTEMFTSQATVDVYQSGVLVATYHVPTGSDLKGTIWNVFELDGGTITPINRITTGGDESSAFDPYGGIVGYAADEGISAYSEFEKK